MPRPLPPPHPPARVRRWVRTIERLIAESGTVCAMPPGPATTARLARFERGVARLAAEMGIPHDLDDDAEPSS